MLIHWQNLYALRSQRCTGFHEAQSSGTSQQSKNPPFVCVCVCVCVRARMRVRACIKQILHKWHTSIWRRCFPTRGRCTSGSCCSILTLFHWLASYSLNQEQQNALTSEGRKKKSEFINMALNYVTKATNYLVLGNQTLWLKHKNLPLSQYSTLCNETVCLLTPVIIQYDSVIKIVKMTK
jgi:hypothetical protein